MLSESVNFDKFLRNIRPLLTFLIFVNAQEQLIKVTDIFITVNMNFATILKKKILSLNVIFSRALTKSSIF